MDVKVPAGKPAFLNPFEVETPKGAEGWQGLYRYYALLSEERRAFEEGKFWFFDGMHNPEPLYPFDTIMTDNWWVAASQMSTRVWALPPALGIDHRVINGYLYVSPNAVTDPAKIAERAEYFTRRAGYYFENWDTIFTDWKAKAQDCIDRLRAIEFSPLPEYEPETSITGHAGRYSSLNLLQNYSRLIENMLEMGSYHFEMLNLGYGAYLTFREFCQNAFPGTADQTITDMVSGIDILLFRPDDELRKLARQAVDLDVADIIMKIQTPDDILVAMQESEAGRTWIAALEAVKDPWFWYSTGSGYCHADPVWMTDLRLPFTAMRGYITAIRQGEDVRRPLDKILERRAKVTDEYRSYLPTDDDREAFDSLIELARKVFPFVEDHNFYVEHLHHSIFWSKVRQLGDVFVAHKFFETNEDIFYLHRHEVYDAIYDLMIGWAVGTQPRGQTYWKPIVAERRRIRNILAKWTPPPALGTPPDTITEPLTIMLWGITQETIEEWMGIDAASATELRGIAASAGKVRGRARVITDPDHLYDIEDGEILVCRVTAPSWAPVFPRIRAAVSDVGGMMAHTAIICREYGLPAVVGTGFATARMKTGDMIEVDGNIGLVRILDGQGT
ncbi:PEP-utilizing enzyme [Acetobacter conturbans]|uniref:PEP-utilizing protein mobile subunit n=1 Tax=Acetobacter conturbans TaxID=1737472 RepID=A0ABX0K2X9_9PROT|nr:PEP-utilizing enzyme [Acetobacter conturbans]NHN90074.1 PEP-utilizing protein mobile subunit [Acetobacter conturbans]